jgi:hypothetical protein
MGAAFESRAKVANRNEKSRSFGPASTVRKGVLKDVTHAYTTVALQSESTQNVYGGDQIQGQLQGDFRKYIFQTDLTAYAQIEIAGGIHIGTNAVKPLTTREQLIQRLADLVITAHAKRTESGKLTDIGFNPMVAPEFHLAGYGQTVSDFKTDGFILRMGRQGNGQTHPKKDTYFFHDILV